MRVLVLEPDPVHGGGSEAVCLDLAAGLARRGHAITLLHDGDGSMLPRYRQFAQGVSSRRLSGFERRRPLRTLSSVARLAGAVRAARADVILSSHLGYLRHAALVRSLGGAPSCFHLGLPAVGSSVDLRMAYARIGAGVAPSEHTRQTWLRDGWPAGALHVVPNWVDTTRFAPAADRAAARAALDLPADGGLVLYMGRLSQAKGVKVLLEAFTRLPASAGAATLVLVGRGADDYVGLLRERIAGLALGYGRRVLLRPATSEPEAYYAAADAACVPSLEVESFGLAVVEAMSCAVPVVASGTGVIPRILGDAGRDLVVPPGDADAVAATLAGLLERPEAAVACGAALRADAVARHGLERGVDAYEAILQRLVPSRTRDAR